MKRINIFYVLVSAYQMCHENDVSARIPVHKTFAIPFITQSDFKDNIIIYVIFTNKRSIFILKIKPVCFRIFSDRQTVFKSVNAIGDHLIKFIPVPAKLQERFLQMNENIFINQFNRFREVFCSL